MNTAGIVAEIARQTHDISTAGVAKHLAWANFGYNRVAHDVDYPHLRRETTFSTVAGTARYIPSEQALRVLSLRIPAKNRYLIKTSLERMEISNPDWDSETTYFEPDGWFPVAWRAVRSQPAAGIKPWVVSTSASDSTPVVTIEGLRQESGWTLPEIDRETVTLSGTTPLQATKTYTEFHMFSKSAKTVGRVSLQNLSASPTIVYATLSPLGYQKTYLEVGLSPIPDAVYAVTVKYIPWMPELVNDSDVPLIPETDHEVIVMGALTHAGVHASNPQLQDAAERSYQKALSKLRSRMQDGNSQVPAWKNGGDGVVTYGAIPPFSDFLRRIYWG